MLRISSFSDFFETHDGIYFVSLITGAVILFNGYSEEALWQDLGCEAFCKKHNLFDLGIVTKLSREQEHAFAEKLLDALWSPQKKSGGVVFLPTFMCNLDCEYCYQKDVKKPKRKTISSEEIAVFLEYLKKKDVKHVTLFGGEPLLRANLKRLLPVLNYIKENDVKCSAVTNGTEIDIYQKYLGADCISAIQITLDGDETHHNALRKRKNGHGSWREIYRNINMAIEHGVHVSIRMNVSSTNVESCRETKSLLKKQYGDTGLFKCYMGKISGGCGDLSYGQQIESLYHPALRDFPNLQNKAFFPKGSFCSRTARIKSLIFAPTGIWDCWHHVGDEYYKIGNYASIINTNDIAINTSRDHLMQFSKQCLECKYLFVCSGDCSVYHNPKIPCDKEKMNRMFHENILQKLHTYASNSAIADSYSEVKP